MYERRHEKPRRNLPYVKTCRKCHLSKENDEYRGRRTTCYECEKDAARKRAEINGPRLVEKRKREWEVDPEKRRQHLEQRAIYYQLNIEKERERSRNWQREHKQEVKESNATKRQEKAKYVNQKKDVPCADCKLKFPPECMDFDHVVGEKICNVSAMVTRSYSLEAVKEEIEKCDVVCSNCHRKRTVRRINAAG